MAFKGKKIRKVLFRVQCSCIIAGCKDIQVRLFWVTAGKKAVDYKISLAQLKGVVRLPCLGSFILKMVFWFMSISNCTVINGIPNYIEPSELWSQK